jgi:hypothetical protein
VHMMQVGLARSRVPVQGETAAGFCRLVWCARGCIQELPSALAASGATLPCGGLPWKHTPCGRLSQPRCGRDGGPWRLIYNRLRHARRTE